VAQPLLSTAIPELVELPPGHALTSVDVYVTSQCNRRCTYCFLPAEFFASGLRMSVETFSGIVAWCQRYAVPELTFLGGEPSLLPAFPEMVALARNGGLSVRVVTNGARRFRRLLETRQVEPRDLGRVAVSLDTMDEAVQDHFRGRGAWRDAMDTIALLRQQHIPFDINVTAVRSALTGIEALIRFASDQGCRRVNVHWPSTIGLGTSLAADEIPGQHEWADLVRSVAGRIQQEPFIEVERGFLSPGEQLTGCALDDYSNLQILPDGRAYRCGLLVDQADMASLTMTGDQLHLARPGFGEELLRSTVPAGCDACPALQADGRRACIYDKVSSA
jgi:MoaA/NifB/PqqE/SkfB family radical SAM enzyme